MVNRSELHERIYRLLAPAVLDDDPILVDAQVTEGAEPCSVGVRLTLPAYLVPVEMGGTLEPP